MSSLVLLDHLAQRLRAAAERSAAGPRRVIGVDGHSSSGKTSLAVRLAEALDGTVVHTDDLAWFHGAFSWGELLVDGVLTPYRAGEPVAYRPPQSDLRGRPGAVGVPVGTRWLVVEGVACTRPTLRGHFDATVWVETAPAIRLARDAVRVDAGEMSPADYASWMIEENAVLGSERPWRDADVLVSGEPLAAGPESVLVLDGDQLTGARE